MKKILAFNLVILFVTLSPLSSFGQQNFWDELVNSNKKLEKSTQEIKPKPLGIPPIEDAAKCSEVPCYGYEEQAGCSEGFFKVGVCCCDKELERLWDK